MKNVALLILATLTSCRASLEITIEVDGEGSVLLDGETCTGSCLVKANGPSLARQVSREGSMFLGWSGLCDGSDADCLVSRSGLLRARFGKRGRLVVETRGSGSVKLGTGTTCSEAICEYRLERVTTVDALPAPGSQFDGFAGACVGFDSCSLQEGLVVAVFSLKKQPLRFIFDGDGGGEVASTEGLRCSDDCLLEVEPGMPYTFTSIARKNSLPAVFGGDCAGAVCTVVSPATVRVTFELGRQLNVTSTGRGNGRVVVNASPCDLPCSRLVSTAPLIIEAEPKSSAYLVGFAGDCSGLEQCRVPAGQVDVSASVEFDKVLQWSRSFPVTLGAVSLPGLLVDDVGIVAAPSGSSIEIDGKIFTSPGDLTTSLVLLNWDGGVQAAVQLFDNEPGTSSSYIFSLARGDAGELAGFGACAGTGFIDKPCGGDAGVTALYPVAFTVVDGGVAKTFVDHDSPGEMYRGAVSANGSFVVLGERYVSTRLYQFGSDLSLLRSVSTPFRAFQSHLMTTPDGSLLGSVASEAGFNWLGCVSASNPLGLADTLIIGLDPGLNSCTVRARAEAQTSGAISFFPFIAFAPGRPVVFVGNAVGTVDFGPGIQFDAGPGSYVNAVLGDNGFSSLRTSARPGDGLLAGAWWSSAGLQVAGQTLTRSPYFGEPNPSNRAFVATFEEDGGVRTYRRITDPDTGPYSSGLRAGHSLGRTVLVMFGKDLSFEGELLAPDSRERLFVIVLKER